VFRRNCNQEKAGLQIMRALKLGSAFGIGIYVHWTFTLLVGYVLYRFWDRGGIELALYTVALLLAMFACVVLHELGHALMARHFGVPTLDITLYPIGGIARLQRMPEKPVEELLIALAGPAVNIVLAMILFVPTFLSLSAGFGDPSQMESLVQNSFVVQLFSGNLILAMFNLLPAFPMDGGRVLRALLAPMLGRLRATEVAATLGTIFAAVFILIGLFGNPILILLGIFAFLAGQQELALVRYREHGRWGRAATVLPAHEDILDVVPADAGPIVPSRWNAQHGGWIVINDPYGVHKHSSD
jgi:Zn-dependent protease